MVNPNVGDKVRQARRGMAKQLGENGDKEARNRGDRFVP